VLCERGIRSFDTATRFTLDLTAVPLIKELSHLPIIVDPSHGTGKPELIPAMAMAGLAAGADGIHIEVHSRPEEAWSDGAQALRPPEFAAVVAELRKMAEMLGKTF
jgi:3-deoxy-7-phosphoheptulonate synthase